MLEFTALKPSVQKQVNSRILAIKRMHELEPDAPLSVQTLGEDFVTRGTQWRVGRDFVTFKLGELADMLNALSSVCQFEVSETKVEQLLTSPKNGFFKSRAPHPLYMEPEVIQVQGNGSEPSEFFLGGGRHRVVALLMAYSHIAGWREFDVVCRMYTTHDKEQALEYIRHSNSSRNMTTTETSQLELGMSIQSHETKDFFFEAAKAKQSQTHTKTLCSFAFAQLCAKAQLKGNDGSPITLNTLAKLGSQVLTKFLKAVNDQLKAAHGPKSSINKLMLEKTQAVDGSGESTFIQEVTKFAATQLIEDWDACYSLCKATNAKGVVEYNFARATGKVAQVVADALAADFAPQLIEYYEAYTEKKQAETEAVRQAKEAKAQQEEATRARQALETLRATGVELDPNIVATLNAMAAQTAA